MKDTDLVDSILIILGFSLLVFSIILLGINSKQRIEIKESSKRPIECPIVEVKEDEWRKGFCLGAYKRTDEMTESCLELLYK